MSVVVCAHVPRFALIVATGGRGALLEGPTALAPEPGRAQRVGECSAAAGAAGVRAGLPIGEALARAPRLVLVAPDPVAVEEAGERMVGALEALGAVVEPGPPGTAWLPVASLRRLHGGDLGGVLRALRGALGRHARLGVAPTRFLAEVAARRARAPRPVRAGHGDAARGAGAVVVDRAAALAEEPLERLALREDLVVLLEPLGRLGVGTLGALTAMPRATVAGRFGTVGGRAHDLAAGREAPLRPREPGDRLEAEVHLPEAASGEQLAHALGILVDRLLAHPRRRHRPLRAVALQATLVERGTWQQRIVLREAMEDSRRLRLAIGGHLAALPAPAEALRLRADRLGDPFRADRPLWDEDREIRRGRLREAVRQVRAAAGPEAALHVVELDPGSRVPERRMALTPFET